jgi:hypothetical protein
MQVSWIDPEDVRDFVEHLQGPPTSASRPATPDLQEAVESAKILGFGALGAGTSSSPEAAEAPVSMLLDAPMHEPPASPEVALIREKLRRIRDRAQSAGLMTSDAAAATDTAAPRATEVFAPSGHPTPAVRPEEPGPSPIQASVVPVLAAPSREKTRPPAGQTMAEDLSDFAAWAARSTSAEELILLNEHGDLLWGSPTCDDLVPSAMVTVNAALRASIGSPSPALPMLRAKAAAGKELSILCCSTRQGPVILAMVNAKNAFENNLRENLIQAIEKSCPSAANARASSSQ